MDRGAKPAKAKVEAKRPLAESPSRPAARVRELETHLARGFGTSGGDERDPARHLGLTFRCAAGAGRRRRARGASVQGSFARVLLVDGDVLLCRADFLPLAGPDSRRSGRVEEDLDFRHRARPPRGANSRRADGSGVKPAKAKVEARRPAGRKPVATNEARVRELEQRLADAVAQQAATSEILRVDGCLADRCAAGDGRGRGARRPPVQCALRARAAGRRRRAAPQTDYLSMARPRGPASGPVEADLDFRPRHARPQDHQPRRHRSAARHRVPGRPRKYAANGFRAVPGGATDARSAARTARSSCRGASPGCSRPIRSRW